MKSSLSKMRYQSQNNVKRPSHFTSFKDLSILLKKSSNNAVELTKRQLNSQSRLQEQKYKSESSNKILSKKKEQIFEQSNLMPQLQQSFNKSNKKSKSLIRDLNQYRNTTIKINSLSENLTLMKAQIREARREILNCLSYKNELQSALLQQLSTLKTNNDKQIKGLMKKVGIKNEVNEQRVQQIRSNVNQLWQSSEMMKQHLFQIRMKIEKIQSLMGFVYLQEERVNKHSQGAIGSIRQQLQ